MMKRMGKIRCTARTPKRHKITTCFCPGEKKKSEEGGGRERVGLGFSRLSITNKGKKGKEKTSGNTAITTNKWSLASYRVVRGGKKEKVVGGGKGGSRSLGASVSRWFWGGSLFGEGKKEVLVNILPGRLKKCKSHYIETLASGREKGGGGGGRDGGGSSAKKGRRMGTKNSKKLLCRNESERSKKKRGGEGWGGEGGGGRTAGKKPTPRGKENSEQRPPRPLPKKEEWKNLQAMAKGHVVSTEGKHETHPPNMDEERGGKGGGKTIISPPLSAPQASKKKRKNPHSIHLLQTIPLPSPA